MTPHPGLDAVPQPITPGPQMRALARFHPDITWTGTIEEGGMGPGTPVMTATGWGKHHPIQGGNWIVGTYEQDQYLADGTFVLRWQLHWVAGWDPASCEYRATIADNYGHAGIMRGWIDGDRLTFETIGDPPVRLRLTWDISDPASMLWRNEMSAGGGPWALVEEYHCQPASDERLERSSRPTRRPLLGLRRTPGRLALAVFRMPLRAYQHQAGWLLGRTFVEFTHVGRRTGTPYQAVAMVLRYDAAAREAVVCAAWGPETDWVRNLRAGPPAQVRIGREAFVPGHRFLSEDEAFDVAVQFRREHPHRLDVLSAILGWSSLRDDATVRDFVRTHPFVAFRPAEAGPA